MCRAEAAACPSVSLHWPALLWDGGRVGQGAWKRSPRQAHIRPSCCICVKMVLLGQGHGLTICDPCFPAVNGSLGQEELEDLWHQVSDRPSALSLCAPLLPALGLTQLKTWRKHCLSQVPDTRMAQLARACCPWTAVCHWAHSQPSLSAVSSPCVGTSWGPRPAHFTFLPEPELQSLEVRDSTW